MKLVCGLLILASVNADDVANVAPETDLDASMPPNAIPGFDGKLPTPEELLEMLDSLSGLSDEEKAKLREDLLNNARTGGQQQQVAGSGVPIQTLVLLSLLGLVALIFGKYSIAMHSSIENRIRNLVQLGKLGIAWWYEAFASIIDS